jgi:LPXTG-motif cell wall-anchored protein
LGGTESDHNGFDFPEKDDENQKYLYYVVELGHDGEPLELGENAIEGYVLAGYSANNSTGVSSQGQIIVYNKKEDTNSVSIDILKSDDVPDSTNFLEGAVFRLEYRPDPTRTWVSASAIEGLEIEPLDGDSCFTVPLEGITLTGLTDGQYRLEEISPPEGYIKTIDFPVTFTVSDGAITGTDDTIETVRYTPATKTANAEFIIPNTPGAALPHTGGIGTTTFYILGSILVTGCAIVLISRRRLRND